MKNLFLTLCFITVMPIIHAQVHDDLQNTSWFIDSVLLNGETYPSPLVNLVGVVDPNIEFEETLAFAVVDPESDSFFSDVVYDATEFSFIFTNPTITLPGCQQYCDFAQKYFEFLFGDGENVPFTYEILVTDAGGQFLIITDEFGNKAFYQDTPILELQDQALANIKLYPNPATNRLYLAGNSQEITHISIYSISGTMVTEKSELDSGIDVSSLNSGIYLIKITSEYGSVTKKILKN